MYFKAKNSQHTTQISRQHHYRLFRIKSDAKIYNFFFMKVIPRINKSNLINRRSSEIFHKLENYTIKYCIYLYNGKSIFGIVA